MSSQKVIPSNFTSYPLISKWGGMKTPNLNFEWEHWPWIQCYGRTWFSNFRVLVVRQNSHLKQVKLGTSEYSAVNQAIQRFPYTQAVIRHLVLEQVMWLFCLPSHKMGIPLRSTPAQMFQHIWFLFCMFGVEGVKRTAKSSLPFMKINEDTNFDKSGFSLAR